MSTTQELFQQAQTAEAAYADFWDDQLGVPIVNRDDVIVVALTDNGFSDVQANAFVDEWQVVHHIPDGSQTGFSATLFESLHRR